MLQSPEPIDQSGSEIHTAKLVNTPTIIAPNNVSIIGTLMNYDSDLIDVVNGGCGTEDLDSNSYNQLPESQDIMEEHLKMLAGIELQY